MKPGIERIKIVGHKNGRGAERFDVAEPCWPLINLIYRGIFKLPPGDVVTECTAQEKLARLDIDFGIDVILNFMNGMTATVQEKVLRYDKKTTVTVEYMQDHRTGEPGDWFDLKCDYYFVGYKRTEYPALDEWMLLDWNTTKLATLANKIAWFEDRNSKDGARASFKYAHFSSIYQFASECIIKAWFKTSARGGNEYVGKNSEPTKVVQASFNL